MVSKKGVFNERNKFVTRLNGNSNNEGARITVIDMKSNIMLDCEELYK